MLYGKMKVVKLMNVDLINVITLAYLGDAVYEVYIREYLIKRGIAKVDELQQEAKKYVSAKSQSKIVTFLIEKNILSDLELDIFKRGRNYKRETHPKNTDIITYKMATGFETLIGYLYLDNKITKDITDYIIELASEDVSRVVFKDNGFASDADKTNIKETLRSHNIDEFITI